MATMASEMNGTAHGIRRIGLCRDVVQDRQDDRRQANEQAVREDIRWVFTVGTRHIPARALVVPGTDMSGRKEVPQGLERVIANDITDAGPWAALLTVLQSSDCPLVHKLREALAENYAEAVAAEVGMCRGDAE